MNTRLRRTPNHAMLFTGYYNHPAYEQRMHNGFAHEQQMHVHNIPECKTCGGDYMLPPEENVATNIETSTQIAENLPNIYVQPTEQILVSKTPEIVETVQNVGVKETLTTETPAIRPQKSIPNKDDDEDMDWPMRRGFFNIFPISFGLPDSMGRSGGLPGGATAIANSVSTGRGSVATSHATAFGDPSEMYRNAFWKNKKQ